MRGPEWDDSKSSEVTTLRRMGAFDKVRSDNPTIRGWRVVETMWAGRVKRKADGQVDKYKGRCVLRGDLHKSTYKLLFGVALAYLAVVILFAPLFLAVNEDAALELHNFGEAAALSLETLMTIGCE